MPTAAARARAAFPALAGRFAFLENAGGSQVPAVVADRMHDYMTRTYVQLGAGYPLSRECTRVVEEAHAFVGMLMNARGGHVMLGPSTSQLLRMLADAYLDALPPGREIVVAETGHEANVGPWVRLSERGHRVIWWPVDRAEHSATLRSLEERLSGRTALVALPHVSNLLGKIEDLGAIVAAAHRAGARVVADGVAYAPHRAMDVAAWDVDWYAYSTYKVYGPHMAALYGKADAVAELTGPNHFFIPREEVPYKFELGGASHEGCAGILALGDYLSYLVGGGGPADRATVERAFTLMTECELPLQARLLGYLRGKSGVRIVGPAAADADRVGTVSFVHERMASRAVSAAMDDRGIGIRHGHMYAYRLCRTLGLDPEDGVVRVSFVHYNTIEEIERLIAALDAVLP